MTPKFSFSTSMMVEILKVLKDPGEAARDDDFGSSFSYRRRISWDVFLKAAFKNFRVGHSHMAKVSLGICTGMAGNVSSETAES